MKAIDEVKAVAIDAGKKLVEKAAKKLTAPISQVGNKVIAEYVDTSEINLKKLIDGSSVNHPTASNAIYCNSRPRKTVKWMRFKSDIIFFLLLLKMMADILKFTENATY